MMNTLSTPRRTTLLFTLPLLLISLVLLSWTAVPLRMPANNSSAAHIDQQPEFPGGQEALIAYLGKTIKYPEAAAKEKVEGTVYISFTVVVDGSITNVELKRGVRDDIDAEAMRVVKGMPKWNPAKAHGKVVDAQMTLPIAFRLTDAK